MKIKALLFALLAIFALVAFSSCDLMLTDGQILFYYGMNNSMALLFPAEITLFNQLTGINIMTAFMVDPGTDLDYSSDLLGSFGISSGNSNTIVGVPVLNPINLELTFSDNLLGTVVYNLDTAGNDYDIYVRVDTGPTNPITPRSINTTVTDVKQNGILVTIAETPRN